MAQVDPHSQPNSDREAEERFLDRLEEMGLLADRPRPMSPAEWKRRWRPVEVPGPSASEIIIRDRR